MHGQKKTEKSDALKEKEKKQKDAKLKVSVPYSYYEFHNASPQIRCVTSRNVYNDVYNNVDTADKPDRVESESPLDKKCCWANMGPLNFFHRNF